MNPHMIWLEGGRKFACTFCNTVTQTPHDYIENVGPDGRRRDADSRPELSCGSYEFVAGQQYQVCPRDWVCIYIDLSHVMDIMQAAQSHTQASSFSSELVVGL